MKQCIVVFGALVISAMPASRSFADEIVATRTTTTLVDVAPMSIPGLTRPVTHHITFDAAQAGSQVVFDCREPITLTEAGALADYYKHQVKIRHGSAKLAAQKLEEIYSKLEEDMRG